MYVCMYVIRICIYMYTYIYVYMYIHVYTCIYRIVFTTCLLARCRLELNKAQTIDRACMQMQVLIEQYFDEEPGVSQRVAFIYSVPYPPRWSVKKELADSMMRVGMLRTAGKHLYVDYHY